MASNSFSEPWVEKYRPHTLDDVVGNEEAIDRLKVISQQGNLPNLILAGPPGIGKTTSVLCLARSMLGEDVYKDCVLELNASDARTLEVVRSSIKMFAKKKVSLPPGRHKIIILDEADSMTKEAQQALRRIMEMYSNTTRFVLACNLSSKIIEPIQSRCAVLRFQRLTDLQVLRRVQQVIKKENVSHTQDGLEALLFISEGDLRNALNALQATCSGFDVVNSDNVFKVCDQPHPMIIQQVIQFCLAKDISKAYTNLNYLLSRGYSAQDVVNTVFKVTKNFDMPEATKLAFIKEISETHMRIADGLQSPLQMAGLVARLCKVSNPQKQQTTTQ
eukprot:gb/GECH01013512.1/.p1 GENE.gb/GECH01013512.1/~~gb/GECH01013512.1/.p1  ORF type:complete len:332 (+),score=75.60 gb/GECH01013512.1/:1-996(+)